MIRKVDLRTRALADAFASGKLSRRDFITRLMALGVAAPIAAGLSMEIRRASAAGLKGNVRLLVGPWSDGEVDHHKHIAEGFKAMNPDVTFDFRLYQWDTAAQEINTSVAQGAHDIYMTTESSYPDYESGTGFADLTARINDPSFAAEKAKYLYWDRTESYGSKLLGLPISWHVEDALFVNMDMVNKAGYDETFVDKWETFHDCCAKMTKKGETYGAGFGIQIGGYGEWYQVLRGAGGSYLTADKKAPNVNLPDVIAATERMAALFKDGIAPPLGTYSYDAAPAAFAAGKMATLTIDLAATTVLPNPVPFKWKLLPHPPGPAAQVNFNDVTYYMVNAKSGDQNLMWEVLKWWTSGENDAYWADNSGTYPARSDAADKGYGKNAAPQLAEALPVYVKHAVGLENFAQWADVENQAEAEIQNCYSGKESAQDAVANVEKIVKHEVGL
ncbi:MAG TPA: extracellular solute-binding protein [Candidatus Cybelea sp.]|nr:extracellular solute-binding protein [Candidatus Cybelea sp.]